MPVARRRRKPGGAGRSQEHELSFGAHVFEAKVQLDATASRLAEVLAEHKRLRNQSDRYYP
jgi:hypothetical protein